MFLPWSDAPNPPRFQPLVTRGLIAINVLVWFVLLQSNDYQAVLQEYGHKATRPALLTLFTSMFLHADVVHLAGNMLFLWIYGDNVEHRFGRWRFLVVYLVCGVAATLAFSLLTPASDLPMVGASGAISGVLGAYFLMFPRNKVRVLVVLLPFLLRSFEVPARIVLGAYVVLDNLLPVVLGLQSGVAYGAHLGGFFAGLGIGAVVEWSVARRHAPNLWTPAGRARMHIDVAEQFLARGQYATALQHFWRAAQVDPGGAAGQHAEQRLRELRW
ncbi:MAG: rhomboid family intramembrane serine protease [Planctomycetes bacterium]|nr:rhomboid family intramembrane serine protease [Planctomycetota bacterium]